MQAGRIPGRKHHRDIRAGAEPTDIPGSFMLFAVSGRDRAKSRKAGTLEGKEDNIWEC